MTKSSPGAALNTICGSVRLSEQPITSARAFVAPSACTKAVVAGDEIFHIGRDPDFCFARSFARDIKRCNKDCGPRIVDDERTQRLQQHRRAQRRRGIVPEIRKQKLYTASGSQ